MLLLSDSCYDVITYDNTDNMFNFFLRIIDKYILCILFYYDLFSFGLYFLIKSASFPVRRISFASSWRFIEGKDKKRFGLVFWENLKNITL